MKFFSILICLVATFAHTRAQDGMLDRDSNLDATFTEAQAQYDVQGRNSKATLRGRTPQQSNCATVFEMNEAIARAANAIPEISQAYYNEGGGKAGSATRKGCKAAFNKAVDVLDSLYDFKAGVLIKPAEAPFRKHSYRTTRNGALS